MRWYLLFVLLTVVSIVLLLPATLTIAPSSAQLCERTWVPLLCRNIPPTPIIIHRPQLAFTLFGKTVARDLNYVYGLDINGGMQVTLRANLAGIPVSQHATTSATVQRILTRRLEDYGIVDAQFATLSQRDAIQWDVTLRSQENMEMVKALLGTTANLDFREYQPASGSATATPSAQVKDYLQTDLTGDDLVQATVLRDPTSEYPMVGIAFNSTGAQKFATLTRRNIGKPLAIFLDDYPISVPRVDNEITDGRAMIRGDFSEDQARSLASVLNSGPLPVEVGLASLQTAEPFLGRQTLSLLLKAGGVGLFAITLGLLLLYRLRGILASVVIVFLIMVSLVLYKLLLIPITMAGIVGLFLSLCIAVDSIIVGLERLAEEERTGTGRSLPAILSLTFKKNNATISDANIFILTMCFCLANPFDWSFLVQSSVVRSFGVTLALGILLNAIVGQLLLKVLLTLFYRPKAGAS
jgi:preprotein translocase subunit SecD